MNVSKLQSSIYVTLVATIIIFSIYVNTNKTYKISGWSKKYWDIYRMRHINYPVTRYGYLLKRDNECIYYSYSKNNMKGNFKRDIFDFGDVVYSEKWFIKNGDRINIMGFDFKVLLLTSSEMTLVNNLNLQDTIYLRHSLQ